MNILFILASFWVMSLFLLFALSLIGYGFYAMYKDNKFLKAMGADSKTLTKAYSELIEIEKMVCDDKERL